MAAAAQREVVNNELLLTEKGNIVLRKTSILREGGLDDLLSRFRIPHTTELPRNARWVTEGPNSLKFVIELEPTIHLLKTSAMRRGLPVSMPWQYFVFVFEGAPLTLSGNTYLLWSANRIKDPNEVALISAPLPNIYNDSNGRICFGNAFPHNVTTPVDLTNYIVNTFYSPDSVFNDHLGWHKPRKYQSYVEWAEDSKKDPFCFLTWPEFDSKAPKINLSTLVNLDTKAALVASPFEALRQLVAAQGTVVWE